MSDGPTDSGPLLRLEARDRHLTKAERYGHPYERPLARSRLRAARAEALVLGYFRHALRGVAPRPAWTWKEIAEFNRAIDWGAWEREVWLQAEA